VGVKINPLTDHFKFVCLVDFLAAYLIYTSYELRIGFTTCKIGCCPTSFSIHHLQSCHSKQVVKKLRKPRNIYIRTCYI
jgi:hypothetical protein